MKIRVFVAMVIVFIVAGCSVKHETLNTKEGLSEALARDLMALSPKIDPKEALLLAKESLAHTRVLAKQYQLMTPPDYHNALTNMGYRERGLCHEWAEDMMVHLKKQNFKSFDLRWGIAFKGEPKEHNSVVVVAKGKALKDGMLIDPWRLSGELYWKRVTQDKGYVWLEDTKRSVYLGTITQLASGQVNE